MIDLRTFCGTEEDRPYLHKPISRNGYTYATNGHIGVRVPGGDVTTPDEYGQADKVAGAIDKYLAADHKPLAPAALELPAPSGLVCFDCDGRGRAHSCKNCDCACRACGGSGVAERQAPIILRDAQFSISYVRLLAALPGLQLPIRTPRAAFMYFSFDGGEGALMPMRWSDSKDVPQAEP